MGRVLKYEVCRYEKERKIFMKFGNNTDINRDKKYGVKKTCFLILAGIFIGES